MNITKIDNTIAYSIQEGDFKQTVAFAVLCLDDMAIRLIYVDPEHRTQGYAQALVNKIVADVEQSGYRGELKYHCHPDNEESSKVARKCDFTEWRMYFKQING